MYVFCRGECGELHHEIRLVLAWIRVLLLPLVWVRVLQCCSVDNSLEDGNDK
jgi:hypothetical protein